MQYFNGYSSECVEQFVSLMTDSFPDQKVQLAWNIVISFPLKYRTCFLLGILSVLNFMEFEKLDQRDLVQDYATCEMWKDQKKDCRQPLLSWKLSHLFLCKVREASQCWYFSKTLSTEY